MTYRFLLIFGLFILSCSVFSADDVINTKTFNTLNTNSIINTTQLGMPKYWDLTETEWIQYLNLMKGPSGHYYEKLSPPEVLGINATSNEDMYHFAEIAAKQEHDKLERELKFNMAFHEAAAKIYSNEEIIKPFDLSKFTPIPKN